MKPMHVVIEGADGSGKSTLAGYLMQAGVVVETAHMKAPKDEADGFNQATLMRLALAKAKEPLCYDRGWLGEPIYAPLKRGYYPKWAREFEDLLPKNILLVVLTAAHSELAARAFERGEKFVSREELGVINAAFVHQFELSTCRYKALIDTTDMGPSDVLDAVVTCLHFAKADFKHGMKALLSHSAQSFEEP